MCSCGSNDYSFVTRDNWSRIDAECFYSDRHQQIYKAIVELSESNCPYDVVMVSNYLKGKNVLHLMGGEEYLIQLMQDAPSSFTTLKVMSLS